MTLKLIAALSKPKWNSLFIAHCQVPRGLAPVCASCRLQADRRSDTIKLNAISQTVRPQMGCTKSIEGLEKMLPEPLCIGRDLRGDWDWKNRNSSPRWDFMEVLRTRTAIYRELIFMINFISRRVTSSNTFSSDCTSCLCPGSTITSSQTLLTLAGMWVRGFGSFSFFLTWFLSNSSRCCWASPKPQVRPPPSAPYGPPFSWGLGQTKGFPCRVKLSIGRQYVRLEATAVDLGGKLTSGKPYWRDFGSNCWS